MPRRLCVFVCLSVCFQTVTSIASAAVFFLIKYIITHRSSLRTKVIGFRPRSSLKIGFLANSSYFGIKDFYSTIKLPSVGLDLMITGSKVYCFPFWADLVLLKTFKSLYNYTLLFQLNYLSPWIDAKTKVTLKMPQLVKPLWVKRALTQLTNDVIVICILLLDTSFRQKCLRTFESWLLCIGRLISKTDNIMHFACLVKPAGVDLVSWLTYLFGGHTSTCQVSLERKALDSWTSDYQVEYHWR